jgi:hypothetical protein
MKEQRIGKSHPTNEDLFVGPRGSREYKTGNSHAVAGV